MSTNEESVQEQVSEAITLHIPDYECNFLMVHVGGCGGSILSQSVSKIDPAKFRNFRQLAVDTDARTQKRLFSQKVGEGLRRLMSEQLVELLSLGGQSVTGFKGAGSDPAVGKKAAEEQETMEALKKAMSQADVILIEGGLGGGTGTGAIPVIAKVAQELGKIVLVFVIMPHPLEGRTEKAKKALSEIKSLGVPTFPFENSYLSEFLDLTIPDPEARKKITPKAARRLMDESTFIPGLAIFQEIIQDTGDSNLDTSDLNTIAKGGGDGSFGFVKINPEKCHEASIEEVVEKMFDAPFQDLSVVRRTKVIGHIVHGSWTEQQVTKATELIKKKALEGRPNEEVEIIPGYLEDAEDGEMWMAVIMTAPYDPSQPVMKPAADHKLPPEFYSEAGQPTSTIRYLSGGKEQTVKTSAAFAKHFNRVHGSIHSTKEEIEKLYDQVEKIQGAKRPDMLSRFEEPPQKKPGMFDFLNSLGFQRRRTEGGT